MTSFTIRQVFFLRFVLLRHSSALIDQFCYWCFSSFVWAYVWFIVFADMSALMFAQSFARAIHSQKVHYLSFASFKDLQVNVWRSKRLAFNDHNHSFSLSTSFDSVMPACAASILWENRFQIVCRRHIDLFTSEWVTHLHILPRTNSRLYASRIHA